MINYNNISSYDNLQVEYTIFKGELPSVFKHTCESKPVILGTKDKLKRIDYNQRVWRDRTWTKNSGEQLELKRCPACFHNKVFRICKQIESEMMDDLDGDWGYIVTNEKTFKNARKTHHRRNENLSYIAFPQTNESLVVFHNTRYFENSQSIPVVYEKIYQIISAVVEDVPKDVRIRHSRGFGKSWANNCGYSEPIESLTDIRIIFFDRKHLNRALKKNNIQTTNGAIDVQILDLIEIMRENNVPFRIVKGLDIVNEMLNISSHDYQSPIV